jgi:hypothetical protein
MPRAWEGEPELITKGHESHVDSYNRPARDGTSEGGMVQVAMEASPCGRVDAIKTKRGTGKSRQLRRDRTADESRQGMWNRLHVTRGLHRSRGEVLGGSGKKSGRRKVQVIGLYRIRGEPKAHC